MKYLVQKAFVKYFLLPLLGAVAAACIVPAATAQTQADIFGFEALQYWSTGSITAASTSTRTQGNSALALSNFSYAEITSSPLSTLSGVGQKFELDIQLPGNFSWGQVQLSVTSPTLGLYNAWVGSASLANLTANTFHKITIPVPTNVENALKQNYSDLVIKLALNLPNSGSTVILDNLRFSGQPVSACTSNINLIVSVEGAFNNDILDDLVCTFHIVYPQLVARFNSNAPQTVYLEVRDIDPPAYASGNHIVVKRQWMLDNPHDTDIMVHEGMHVVQSYNFGNTPGWLTEGIADFVRDAYGLSNIGWSLQPYRYGQHYTNGYGVTANFLKWVEANYNSNGVSRVDQLDQLLRAGQYSDAIWIQWTGYSIDQLWRLYSIDEGSTSGEPPAPLPAQQGITVYEHANYDGSGFTLDVGNYRPIDLTARGVPGSWFDPNSVDSGGSSVRVPAGYRVTLYTSSDLSGSGVQYTSDVAFIGALNDAVHSIKVELIP